jgi:hypothetical protein
MPAIVSQITRTYLVPLVLKGRRPVHGCCFRCYISHRAESLPYEGELRFKLNNHCGYFYF